MPETSVYGFEFEKRTEVPGRTLHGDNDTSPILARQVEDELLRVDSEVSDIGSDLQALEEATIRLAHVSLTGTVSGGTNLVIPASLRGTFRFYRVIVDGVIIGVSYRALLVLPNAITETEYRAQAIAQRPGDPPTIVAHSDQNNVGFPVMGYLGQFGPSQMELHLKPRSLGQTGFISWTGQGWSNDGSSGSAIIQSGGRWNGTSQQIDSFRVRTNNSSDEWGSNSAATLWGIR
jgi:hypothetical protein